MSHIWLSHTHVCLRRAKSSARYANVCQIHIGESHPTYDRVMSNICTWVMSHLSTRHVTHMSESYTRIRVTGNELSHAEERKSHDSFACGTWLIYMWNLTHTWLTRTVHPHYHAEMSECNDSFTWGTWLISVCDMTHLYRAPSMSCRRESPTPQIRLLSISTPPFAWKGDGRRRVQKGGYGQGKRQQGEGIEEESKGEEEGKEEGERKGEEVWKEEGERKGEKDRKNQKELSIASYGRFIFPTTSRLLKIIHLFCKRAL